MTRILLPRIAPSVFITLTALVYTLTFYGFSIFPIEWTTENASNTLWRLTHAFSNVVLTLLVLAIFEWLFLIGVPIVFLASAVIAYFRFRYNITINTNIIGALIETDPSEASAFISVELMSWMLGALLIGLLVSWLFRRCVWRPFNLKRDGVRAYLKYAFVISFFFALRFLEDTSTPTFENNWFAPLAVAVAVAVLISSASRFSAHASPRTEWVEWVYWGAFGAVAVIALVYCVSQETFWIAVAAIAFAVAATITSERAAKPALALALMVTPALSMPTQTETFLPSNAVYAVSYHVIDRLYMREAMKVRDNLGRYAASLDETASEDLVMVLVIGESARGDHFGINGYTRDTTPLLAKEKNLVSFTSARSCAAATRVSVPCLMTRATEMAYTPAYTETSLVSVLAARGFDTTWISTNQIFGRHDSPITAIAQEARVRDFRMTIDDIVAGAHDGAMIPALKARLAEKGKQLIVLHQRGSHWHYADRYPAAYERYKPACPNTTTPSQCETAPLVNAYDNTILYTDYVLSEVINSLRGRKAMMLYVSDHGQSLGEDDFYTHGSPERDEQRNIPFMVWGSDTFLQHHSTLFAQLRTRSKEKVSHDHVFHTFLGCIGLQGGLVEETLNLCAPRAN